ncbi:MAG: nitroreductase family protein [Sphaerochaetaceae bacterium]|nr:nitroreductase family protein [Sphaerochaetaceae bacterium]
MNLIFERHSVRSYQDRVVEPEILNRLCEAGMMAPSAHNAQPWQFLVVTDEKKKHAVSQMSAYARFAADAPALIIVLLDERSITENHTKWQQDLSAATQNILLECVNHGLGGCWLGLYPDQQRISLIRQVLEIPMRYAPFSVVALGYPLHEGKGPKHIYQGKIHYNRIEE